MPTRPKTKKCSTCGNYVECRAGGGTRSHITTRGGKTKCSGSGK